MRFTKSECCVCEQREIDWKTRNKSEASWINAGITWAEKLSLRTEKWKEATTWDYTRRLGWRSGLGYSQQRDRQCLVPGTVGRAQAGTSCMDERAQGWVIEKERESKTNKGREPGMKMSLTKGDKASFWGVDESVGAQWVIPFQRWEVRENTATGDRGACNRANSPRLAEETLISLLVLKISLFECK